MILAGKRARPTVSHDHLLRQTVPVRVHSDVLLARHHHGASIRESASISSTSRVNAELSLPDSSKVGVHPREPVGIESVGTMVAQFARQRAPA